MGDSLADILARLTVLTDNEQTAQTAPATPRVRAINCKPFSIGQDWTSFKDYFRENVRAAHNLKHGDDDADQLDDACCSFIGSKLAPGATLTAYLSLDDDVKNDWQDLDDALTKLYTNEEEKQIFLSNPESFKKGSQSMIAYRNELVRRVHLYQPELKRVDSEYQRQIVNRFISGIEDAKLQRKLRRHCKRDNLNIDEAFNFAVDYESSEFEEKGKEFAAVGDLNLSSSVATKLTTFASAATSHASLEVFPPIVDPAVEANRRDIEELQIGHAVRDEKISQLENDLKSGFQRLESLILGAENNASISPPPPASEAYPLAYAAIARRH